MAASKVVISSRKHCRKMSISVPSSAERARISLSYPNASSPEDEMPFPKDPKAAVHEASHAVIAHELRRNVLICSIGGDPVGLSLAEVENAMNWEASETHAWTDNAASREKSKRIRWLVTILVAGDVGQHIEFGYPLMSAGLPHAYLVLPAGVPIPRLHFGPTDLSRVVFLIQLRLHRQIVTEIGKAEARARRILMARWKNVKIVMTRLLDKGFLTGHELRLTFR